MSVSATVRRIPKCLSRGLTTSSVQRDVRSSNPTVNTPSPDKPVSTPRRRKGRTSKPNLKTQSLLPPQKLRALVSLYHQCDDFITPENLDRRIDATFLDQFNSPNSVEYNHYSNLLEQQRALPKMAPWNTRHDSVARNFSYNNPASWSSNFHGRERQVVEALYGVEYAGSQDLPLPGYETLMQAREAAKKQEGYKAEPDPMLRKSSTY